MKSWSIAFLMFLFGLVLTPLLVFAYLDWGRPPVAVADNPMPLEREIVRTALHHRMDAEMQQAPFSPQEADFVAGAHIYSEQCAFCHGLPGASSSTGKAMFPAAPQLWQSHRAGVVGVSDDPVGETFWRVKNGIRLSGMPSYQNRLSEQQMWQVSLLLSRANQPLGDSVSAALQSQLP